MNRPIITNAKNSMYLHMGVHVFSFLIKGSDTAGKFSMMHIQIRKGFEPPPHTHTRESESFYILEGCIRFSTGEEVFEANPGDFVYLPKNVQHRWESLTEISKVLVILVPAGLEDLFIQFSQPTADSNLPPVPETPPSNEFMQKFVTSLTQDYGVIM